MFTKGRVLLAILGVLLGSPATAQDADRVGQTIVWGESPYAQRYELVVEDQDSEVARVSTTQPRADLHLAPGTYRYRVLVYNLLGEMEVASPWADIEVVEAFVPQVDSLSPDTVFLDTSRVQLVVQGEFLDPGARYLLAPTGRPGQSATGTIVSVSPTAVQLAFASADLSPGDYTLTVVNPGGLQRTSATVVHVRDGGQDNFHLALGYSPGVPVYDSWFVKTWPEFHGGGLKLTGLAEVVKGPSGRLGAEVDASWWRQQGQWDVGTIESQFVSVGGNAVYSLPLSQRLRVLARAGFGVAINWNTIRLGNRGEVQSWYSVVPYGALGVGLLWQPWTNNAYVETGLTVQHLFGDGYAGGLLRPSVSLGVLF